MFKPDFFSVAEAIIYLQVLTQYNPKIWLFCYEIQIVVQALKPGKKFSNCPYLFGQQDKQTQNALPHKPDSWKCGQVVCLSV